MKTLSRNLFKEINVFMETEVRPLEKALFNYHFNDLSEDNVLDALLAFQNSDGGFGLGIEPDFKLAQSSPMATSIGLRYLCRMDNSDRAKGMIRHAIEYLEATFNNDRLGWYSVPISVNNYPHAPWWEFERDINMTVIDYSWGNPSAELIGYLYKYKAYLDNLDIYKLIDYAIDNFNNRTVFNSEHEIFCFIKLYHLLDANLSNKIEGKLKLAISQLVNIDQSDWTNYVPTPVRFIDFYSKNNLGIEQRYIDQNLDYLIDKLEEHGRILPTWEWGQYFDDWEVARKEWMGVLTLEALLSLLKFNRI